MEFVTAIPLRGKEYGRAFSIRACLLTGVLPMIETYPLERADEAYERMMSNKARFRVVLTTGN